MGQGCGHELRKRESERARKPETKKPRKRAFCGAFPINRRALFSILLYQNSEKLRSREPGSPKARIRESRRARNQEIRKARNAETGKVGKQETMKPLASFSRDAFGQVVLNGSCSLANSASRKAREPETPEARLPESTEIPTGA